MVDLFRTWRRPGASGSLHVGEASEFLASLRSETADLVFVDPPFNLGKRYSHEHPGMDSRPQKDYFLWLSTVLLEAVRVVAPGGALYLYHLPQWALRLGADLERHMTLRHWIAIAMKNGFVRGNRLYPAHYALLYFTKGQPTSFSRPKLAPQHCRHCGGLIKDYGGYRAIMEKKGVNLSDVWDDVSPVRHASKKHRDANELPSTITDRVVAISGVDGGLFVDPFGGAGTSVMSAIGAGMRFRACDLLPDNCRVIAGRIDDYKRQARIG